MGSKKSRLNKTTTATKLAASQPPKQRAKATFANATTPTFAAPNEPNIACAATMAATDSRQWLGKSPLAQQRLLLPINKHRTQILYAMEKNGVVVIVGETACGKSTQLPQYLFENGWCENNFQIAVTQPRRIAAQTLAQRVAKKWLKGHLVRWWAIRSDSTTRLRIPRASNFSQTAYCCERLLCTILFYPTTLLLW